MADAFSAAVDAVFLDPNAAVDATYTPAAAAAVAVRVILRQPDRELAAGVPGIQAPSWQADIRTAELPVTAARGDTLTVGADSFEVTKIVPAALRLRAKLSLRKL